eukprot:CAMPEP_0198119240 /NCGR_PEP_ID=MMETSP1442-20131203/24754_1 /TAXON_ID= /ORGANISM="Craspedostauros australis, Strain CCMP3328" /LENGTH=236 /DNA_ID=CAMNT_0043777659 /DNA_START=161 /DNA_END=867 /DNA_ORIENTATION=-
MCCLSLDRRPISPCPFTAQCPIRQEFSSSSMPLAQAPFSDITPPVRPHQLSRAMDAVLDEFAFVDGPVAELIRAPTVAFSVVPLSLVLAAILVLHGALDALALNVTPREHPCPVSVLVAAQSMLDVIQERSLVQIAVALAMPSLAVPRTVPPFTFVPARAGVLDASVAGWLAGLDIERAVVGAQVACWVQNIQLGDLDQLLLLFVFAILVAVLAVTVLRRILEERLVIVAALVLLL